MFIIIIVLSCSEGKLPTYFAVTKKQSQVPVEGFIFSLSTEIETWNDICCPFVTRTCFLQENMTNECQLRLLTNKHRHLFKKRKETEKKNVIAQSRGLQQSLSRLFTEMVGLMITKFSFLVALSHTNFNSANFIYVKDSHKPIHICTHIHIQIYTGCGG